MRILGIDPGFRSMGAAVIEYDGSSARCLEAVVIRTQKTSHKITRWLDNQNRCETIAVTLAKLALKHEVDFFAVEAESWTRTSSDRVIGMARGIIYGVAVTNNYSVIQWHPKDVREELLGKKAAGKAELEQWLCENVEGMTKQLSPITPSQRNHAADAAAIALTEIRRGNLAKIFMAAAAKRGEQKVLG